MNVCMQRMYATYVCVHMCVNIHIQRQRNSRIKPCHTTYIKQHINSEIDRMQNTNTTANNNNTKDQCMYVVYVRCIYVCMSVEYLPLAEALIVAIRVTNCSK